MKRTSRDETLARISTGSSDQVPTGRGSLQLDSDGQLERICNTAGCRPLHYNVFIFLVPILLSAVQNTWFP